MLASDLKNRLQENDIENILESLGCHNIKKEYHKNKPFISCANPDGDNQRAILINLENLYARNFTRQDFEQRKIKDIIALVEYFKDINYFEAIKYICDICKYNYYEVDDKPNILNWLNKIESKLEYNIETINPLPDNILKQFYLNPIKKWFDEEIDSLSQNKFEIGFDIDSERITIPIRDEIGNLVGIKGRLLKDSLIDDDKYIYLYSCPKSLILFGLYQNYKNIKSKNEIIIVEAEKSVIKLNSLGYNNAVAVGSKSISKYQANKILSLNVDITIAFDKDVTLDELDLICKQLKLPYAINKINVVYDSMDLLKDKESPMDSSYNWDILYNYFKREI